MPELVIDISLQVDTALSVGAGGSSGILADKSVVRDRTGRLLLPGSHLKGRLRHACESIARAAGFEICDPPRAETMCPQAMHVTNPPCPICQIFGSPANPSPLQFSDLCYDEPLVNPSIRPGASVNRSRGTVEEQRLFFIETSPPGGLVYFHNPEAVVGRLDGPNAEAQVKLILAGLRLLQSWGGGKSRGLGWGTVSFQASLGGTEITLVGLQAALGGMS